MFARQLCRAATSARLKNQVRQYATEAPQSRRNLYIGIGAAGVAALGSFYYLSGDRARRMSKMSGGQDTAPPSRKEEENVPAVAEKPMMAFKGGDQGFIPLTLDSVEQINHNTKKLRFRLPDVESVSGLHIASALISKFQDPNTGKPVIRPYTPISDEDSKGYLDFVIKFYPGGPMSSHIHDMKPGDTLDMKGPIPKYPWNPNKHEQITLLAGGTGITPMYQLIRAVFKNPEDKTKVTVVFGNITEEDILLKKEFDELEKTHPQQFRAFYLLDKPPEGWQGGKGYITQGLLKTLLPEPNEKNQKIFVCGPPGFNAALSGNKKSPQEQGELSGILKELGYTEEHVYKF